MSDTHYTRADLSAIADDAPPERGLFCNGCRGYVPQFADLTAEQEAALRAMESPVAASLGLQARTGCNSNFAKIWVLHRHGHDTEARPLCPFCSRPLRTHRAQQCFECSTDWHDPDRVLRHGAPLPPGR